MHACIGNVTKIVRIVGVTGSCITAPPAPLAAAETPAHWAIEGQDGKDGLDGEDGINGTSVSFVDYFSGRAGGCSNGGAIYAAGNPPVVAYICNGTNGTDGKDGKDGTGATRADGPCFDYANRYVDCGNGTVTDTVTGLIWLKQWNCLPDTDWVAANRAAAGLKNGDCGLTDNSSAGDWRLPSKDEWMATIAQAVVLTCTLNGGGGPPSLTNDAGTACYGTGVGSSFAGVPPQVVYWSSSSNEEAPSLGSAAHLFAGVAYNGLKVFMTWSVWPVRGGPR